MPPEQPHLEMQPLVSRFELQALAQEPGLLMVLLIGPGTGTQLGVGLQELLLVVDIPEERIGHRLSYWRWLRRPRGSCQAPYWESQLREG